MVDRDERRFQTQRQSGPGKSLQLNLKCLRESVWKFQLVHVAKGTKRRSGPPSVDEGCKRQALRSYTSKIKSII